MSVTCQDLLTLKYFERIKLVAGPNGQVTVRSPGPT